MDKITSFICMLGVGLLISCGNSTGTGPEPEEPNEPEEPAVTTGALEVAITTAGESLDEDGYELHIDEESKSTAPDETITFPELEEGTYQLKLDGVAPNCSVEGDNPLEVAITAEETASVDVQVTCKQALKDKIVFVSNREHTDLYVMGTDGSGVNRLTDTSEEERYPAISPDGTQVVYWQQDPSAGGSYGRLWTLNADGTDPVQLTDREFNAGYPVWSPDGEKIAFSKEKELHVMNADGSEREKLTDYSDFDFAPSWSPDGNTIAFASDRNDNRGRDIFLLDLESGDITSITDDDLYNSYPTWSPDGEELAYLTNEEDPDGMYTPLDLYVMKKDGSDSRKVADLAIEGFRSGDKPAPPSWSPDGSKIVLGDRNGGSHEVYVIETDGSGSRNRLTLDGGIDNIYPNWSPLQ